MKAETDLYCSGCGDKIYHKGDEMLNIAPFRGNEERCSNCETILRRRSPGGQSDTWGFTESPIYPPVILTEFTGSDLLPSRLVIKRGKRRATYTLVVSSIWFEDDENEI